MSEQITVVGNAPFPDIPRGRAVTVVRTARIDGLIASGRITRVDTGGADEVPRLIEAVQAWVDADPERARVALDVEQARTPGPRPTLVSHLEDVIAPPAAHDAPSGDLTDDGHTHPSDDGPPLTGDPHEPV